MKHFFRKNENAIEWVFDFLKNKCDGPKKLEMKDFLQMSREEFNNLFERIIETFAKGYVNNGNKKHISLKAPPPDSSLFCFIMSHTGHKMSDILDMTWEMVDFLIEGIVYNEQEKTKKGQKKNEVDNMMRASKNEISDEDAKKQAREMMKRMDNKKSQVYKKQNESLQKS